ncbi:hypothetical protein BN7_254 [Wickerhamomyces ciferrii]|uniref:C3H1-type domain-containing protein n=1 Tax=Wickerhamomyces ciferrii (strain ATCC 14091 / BCRC 22168 / CBS 111 / JCM 3599 / NBRC 0793 / NRRL Y-1031 F-60-10) TaxID=1206466 RepID=K0K7A8_WICCF|nr:uncharacterized protein BN7_254 [Wickerhamomyces ciferrii]CCH40720.1 hypothetical protein BN7_254 [Wickerhamomyces ciferrii]
MVILAKTWKCLKVHRKVSKKSSGCNLGSFFEINTNVFPDLAHVPCKFYRQGACQAGDSCPFSHTQDSNLDTAPCKYFSKGNCKFGLKCALAHILPDGRRVNPKSLAQVYQSQQAQQQQAQQQAQQQVQQQTQNVQNVNQGIISPPNGFITPGSSIPISNGFNGGNSNGFNQFVGSQSQSMNIISPTQQTTNYNFNTSSSFDHQSPIQYHTRSYTSTSPFQNSIWSQPQTNGNGINGIETKFRSFSHSQIGNVSTRPLFTEPINESAILDDDDEDDDQSIDVFEEDFVPSSLSDLLTPQELKRRGSRPSSSNVRPQFNQHNSGINNNLGHNDEEEMQFRLEEDWLHS